MSRTNKPVKLQNDHVFSSVMANSNEAFVVADLDSVITHWNAAAERVYGYSASEITGRALETLVHNDHKKSLENKLASMRASLTLQQFESVHLSKDNREIRVLQKVAPILDQGQTLIASLFVIAELTRPEFLLRELERSNKALEEFAYMASHDLQEPLRVIASYADLLAQRHKGKLDPKADKYIHYVVDGAKRMRGLINDLLAYSRAGKFTQSFCPVAAEDVLAEAMANLSVSLQETAAEVSHDDLPRVLADRTQLVQLFQNLLANAIKFRGTHRPNIHVSAAINESHCTFAFRDNGIGIAPQHTQRIFIAFQRLHGRDDYPGSGIGLAIAKKIVEGHDGSIWVESTPGEGSTFYFTIPTA